MKELIILSGKGGTGKTSVTAAFATLASTQGKAVFADCDVDAADLHLIFSPAIKESVPFISGHVARVPTTNATILDREQGEHAQSLCRFEAISYSPETGLSIDEGSCEGCGVCFRFCPPGSVEFVDRRCGERYISSSRFGPVVHAALDTRAENSGKLVTAVRKEAKRIAEETGAQWLIVDGSPGIGCPVIASITGCDAALIVTEPTVSGKNDLERLATLVHHFKIPFYVCVNKADIHLELSGEIRQWCERNNIPFVGEIPYDRDITRAQIQGLSIIEYQKDKEVAIATDAIVGIWEKICQLNQ
ncbi:MAG: ATP-binding protein [Spirochaetales bacterium]|nr:ATP-binding protein [Spirochaetales bacterium]